MAGSPPEKCPICPPAGPPTHPRSQPIATSADNAKPDDPADPDDKSDPIASTTGMQDAEKKDVAEETDDEDDDTVLSWIYCPKCSVWYHGICVLSNSPESKETIPESVRKYVDTSEEGVWTDWTKWVDKWFCHKCIASSKDSNNPRPPRQPLVATINSRIFPPDAATPTATRISKRASLSTGEGDQSKAKRRKLRDHSQDEDADPEDADNIKIPQSITNGTERQAERSRSSTEDVIAAADLSKRNHSVGVKEEDPSSESSRPRRQVAMNRPDYHALHHHIATPTARWLDLIHDPEKYNTTITNGNFPRIPASLLRKEWLDSPLPKPDAGPSMMKQDGAPLTPTSDSDKPAASTTYPAHLAPDLYYGPRREPLIIKPEDGGFEGLGGKIPGQGFSVGDVARLVGPNRLVDVIDVATQQSSQWPLKKWADYVAARFGSNSNAMPGSDPASSKVYNVISLEISGTKLADLVKAPTIVSEIDWVDNCWNFGPGGKELAVREDMAAARGEKAENDKGKGRIKAREPWPKVQLYCLMGARGSWTDWHVDFAASSVYYTIHTGAKTFFFIRPTQKNLAAYAEWSGSYEKQQTVWLGDMCDEVRKVELRKGDTMMIPAGYIHAVYTPEDSIVFGGNFLHSYDIPTQLRLRQIEIDTKVPIRFRFPYFDKLCWYVAEKHCSELRALRSYRPKQTMPSSPGNLYSDRVLQGLIALADFLVAQCDIMENDATEEKRRKMIFDRIPELVGDGPALARELKWRVERELSDELDHHAINEDGLATRKDAKARAMRNKATPVLPQKARSRVWNFKPPAWNETLSPAQQTTRKVHIPRPDLNGRVSTPMSDESLAEEVVTVHRQKRSRRRELEDGTTVLEEQEYVATERRVVWEAGTEVARHAGHVNPVMSEIDTGQCVD